MQFLKLFFIAVVILWFLSSAEATDYFLELKKELLSFFPQISGKVIKIEQNVLILDRGIKDGAKVGQRVLIFEETAPLLHPVTRQIIGKSEKIVGLAEVIEVQKEQSKALLIEGSINEKIDVSFKIPKSKIKIFFAQGNTEWALGEGYYRELKLTDRFELIDAPVNVTDIDELIEKGKVAEVLIFLKSLKHNDVLKISQELYWIKDKKLFSTKEIEISPVALKQLRQKYATFIVPEGHTLLSFRLSRNIKRIAAGNFDGSSVNQILIVSDKEISLYKIEVDLKLLSNYLIPVSGEIIWFDTGDIDNDGKDEIVLSLKKDERIISFLIKWLSNEFYEIAKINDSFLRIYNGKLVVQKYSPSLGFEGEVFYAVASQGEIKQLAPVEIPIKANIYDFYTVGDVIFKWENDGFLSIYDKRGILLWISQEPLGFGQQFEKKTGIEMLTLGKWRIPDKTRLINNGIVFIKKNPLLGAVNISTLGYKSSRLYLLQWTGINLEPFEITEEISGEIIDYSVFSDRLFILVKPPFGVNPKRILQGESPFETILHILSFKH
ncbi:MAG: VCBS repeat-containing protein [Thermodesulfovibrionaceae bacterium]